MLVAHILFGESEGCPVLIGQLNGDLLGGNQARRMAFCIAVISVEVLKERIWLAMGSDSSYRNWSRMRDQSIMWWTDEKNIHKLSKGDSIPHPTG